jgi:hypothetical protein
MKSRAILLVLGLALAMPALADDKKEKKKTEMISCSMTFSLKGWSVLYKQAKGTGKVTCDNGETADITIKVKGGGLTVGKSEVLDGTGKFSKVVNIGEIYGGYASAEAHAGAVKSSSATALTKGEISLAISGTGRGWDLGVAFGKFTIKPAKG